MEAPQALGKFEAKFRMETEHKVRFGHIVWCDILVVEHTKSKSLVNSVL